MLFGTRFPDFVRPNLAVAGEPVDEYLKASRRRQWILDFEAIPGWADRLQFLRELMFPPVAYMQARYPEPKSWLPWLYVRRATAGWLKRF